MNQRGHSGRVDANQAAIVKALRQMGCGVQSLAKVGSGCPDLLVGRRGKNLILEVKDDTKPPSARLLTDDEIRWQQFWPGQVKTVGNVEDAIRYVEENT